MRSIYRSCLFLTVVALLFSARPPVIARSDYPGTSQPSPVIPAVSSTSNVPGDEFWDDTFTLEGVSGPVYVVFQYGAQMCIGGDFHQVGSLPAENIACWNVYSKSWSTFASGLSGPVHAIASRGDGKLYVGGQFSQAGSVSVQNFARWNFTTNVWEALEGTSGPVYALAAGDKYIYAGGQFSQAGSTAANNVARFDTGAQTWSALTIALSNGVSGPVYALATRFVASGNYDIFVGGIFSGIGGVSSVNAYNIARWNSVSQAWGPVGGSVSGPVYALRSCGSDLFVGGQFSQAGQLAAHNIASWNFTTTLWSPLGQGTSDTVKAISCVDNRVYVGGYFSQAGSIAADHVARWNITSQTWSALGSGTSGAVFGISVTSSSLSPFSYLVYVGGSFYGAGPTGSQNFALFTGDYDQSNPADVNWDTTFCFQGSTTNNVLPTVKAITADGDFLYYGGFFTSIGRLAANYLARYDMKTSTWSAIGAGVNGDVNAIAVNGNDVYIGGSFTTAGGNPIAYLTRWNSLNNTWSSLGSGPNGPVNAIAISGNNIFVGGKFTTAGGVTVNYIARWNTSSQTWSALGEGTWIGMNAPVKALTVSGSDLYAGGSFTYAQDQMVDYIARWNGSTWSSLGSGLNADVNAIGIKGGYLYAGGSFSQAGGITAYSMARWDGVAWQAMPGLNTPVNAIAFNLGDVFVGGNLDEYAAKIYDVARWDGMHWLPLGSGMFDSEVKALAIGAKGLYVGGGFRSLANGLQCTGSALWKTPTSPPGSGSISGQVRGQGGAPVTGAKVQACRSHEPVCTWIGTTDSTGNYQASALPDGEYIVKTYPPQGLANLPASSGPLIITGGGTLHQDLNLTGTSPLPVGTSLTPARTTGVGVPLVNWKQELLLKAQGCAGGSAAYQVLQSGATIASGALVENPAGQYRTNLAALYPVFGYVQVSVAINCRVLSLQNSTFDVYVDPSGTVQTMEGQAIEGAKVTLFYYDPQTMSLTPVSAGSPLLSPVNQANPDLTDSAGHFGWDVVAGTYLIRAEKLNCTSTLAPYWEYTETGLLESPFALIDLDLRLKCPGDVRKVYLPLIIR